MTEILAHAAYSRHVSCGQVSYTDICFGKHCDGLENVDWIVPSKDDAVRQRKANILRACGGELYFAPNMSVPNANHVRRSTLRNPISIGEGLRVFGNKEKPGEVLLLDKGQGIIVNTSGCSLPVVSHRGTMAVFHVGWRSLLDELRIKNEGGRFNESVVDTAMRTLNVLGPKNEVYVRMRKCIPPRLIPFHTSGAMHWVEFNKKMFDHVVERGWEKCLIVEEEVFYIDIPALVRLQFLGWNVPDGNVDTDDAQWDDEPVWLDGRKGGPRNFDLIVRHA